MSSGKTKCPGLCVACSGNGLAIYPLFGVGAGSVDMKIMGREAASFEEALKGPGRSLRLQTSGFLMHLAVGADRWLWAAGRNGRRGFFIGIRRENRLEVDV